MPRPRRTRRGGERTPPMSRVFSAETLVHDVRPHALWMARPDGAHSARCGRRRGARVAIGARRARDPLRARLFRAHRSAGARSRLHAAASGAPSGDVGDIIQRDYGIAVPWIVVPLGLVAPRDRDARGRARRARSGSSSAARAARDPCSSSGRSSGSTSAPRRRTTERSSFSDAGAT